MLVHVFVNERVGKQVHILRVYSFLFHSQTNIQSTSPLVAAPLFSLLPGEEKPRPVGNPLTGSLDAAGRPTDPDGGCWAGTRSVVVRSLGMPRIDSKTCQAKNLIIEYNI